MTNTNTTLHWAAPLVGVPWSLERNCWWLVREFFAQRYGIVMPDVIVADEVWPRVDNAAAIRLGAMASGWRPVQGEPQADDVVLMQGPAGRHVGVMLQADGRLGVLHNDGCMTERGPRGSVVFQSLAEATDGGYGAFEFWRRAP